MRRLLDAILLAYPGRSDLQRARARLQQPDRRFRPDPAIIAAIEARRQPTFADPDEQAVYQFATMLSHEHRVADAVYQDVRDRFGEQGVAELVGILGYYTLVSMTLNTFEVPVPEGAPPPLTP